jgi:two-component system KDP operon response regulator KdpE
MKILVIDDDAAILEFISIAFDVGWPEAEIITAHHGRKGIETAELELPDLVILDLNLPDISGFDVLRKIRSFSSVPIIVISVKDTEQDVVKCLSIGADDYLIKPFGQLELLARVRCILRRTTGLNSSGCISCGELQLEPAKGELTYRHERIHLTNTECLIMQELMKNIGQVVTYDDLADVIWGTIYPNAVETLRVYVRRLRQKIEHYTQKKIIHSKSGTGYLLQLLA